MTVVATLDQALADIVNQDLRTAPIFESFGLDYCCGGHQTLAEACARRSVDPAIVIDALSRIGPTSEAARLPEAWDELDALTGHIVTHHHTYVRSSVPALQQMLDKLVSVHGERHPELAELRSAFRALGDDLLQHLMKEEQLLFPAVDQMARQRRGLPGPGPMFATVLHPVRVMEDDHQEAGALIERIRQLTGGHYEPPADACTTYRACFAELRRFEEDLHRHIHLENNVLFPRALDLERSLG